MMQQELPLLVVATRNAHKTGEIRAMLAGKWEVRDLSDYPQAPPVEETGVTFTENATLKAVSASKCIPGIVLADDSGLEVDVLGGRPGVWSSSFGGEEGNHERNNRRMLEELRKAGVRRRQACRALPLCDGFGPRRRGTGGIFRLCRRAHADGIDRGRGVWI